MVAKNSFTLRTVGIHRIDICTNEQAIDAMRVSIFGLSLWWMPPSAVCKWIATKATSMNATSAKAIQINNAQIKDISMHNYQQTCAFYLVFGITTKDKLCVAHKMGREKGKWKCRVCFTLADLVACAIQGDWVSMRSRELLLEPSTEACHA